MKLRFWDRVRLEREGLTVATRGLTRKGQAEMIVSVDSPDLVNEAEAFLLFVSDYIERAGARIRSGETLIYGYWLVKFQPTDREDLRVWERDPQFTTYVPGASLTLRYWRDQNAVCRKYGTCFHPPNPGELTVLSAGVMEGRPVQAVRYLMGEPLSGWMIVTDLYDGKIESLTNHCTYHVTAARPDLAKYLALPHGFRFDLTDGEKVWFDPEAANPAHTYKTPTE